MKAILTILLAPITALAFCYTCNLVARIIIRYHSVCGCCDSRQGWAGVGDLLRAELACLALLRDHPREWPILLGFKRLE